MIGVFWVYKNTVLGKARTFSEGEEAVIGLIDSPDTHVQLWVQKSSFIQAFPELEGCEYQDIARGRVLFDRLNNRYIVYLDQLLNTPKNRKHIAQFFNFPVKQTLWRSDLHYTTATDALNELFDDRCL